MNFKGFSSVEVILAATLFVIFTTGIIGTVIQGVSTNRLGNEHVVATQFASEGLDAVRSIKERGFSNITTINNLPRGVTFTAGNWIFDADNTSDTQVHNSTDNYIRQIRIEPVNRDGSGNIVASGGSVDPLTRKVTATVTWNFSSSRPQTVSAVSYLSDWIATVPPIPTGTIIPTATPTTVPPTATLVPPTPTRTPTPIPTNTPIPPTPTPVGGWWPYRKQITILDTRIMGSTNHNNFPVLINLGSDADLAARAQDDGDDIKFTLSDGVTKLDHEIETFNGSTGNLVAWVKIPTLNATANTVIYLYYGNTVASNQQAPGSTWDGTFSAVWHLRETSGTSVSDSSGNGRTGSKLTSTEPNPISGIIAGAQDFDGSNDRILVNTPNLPTGDFTYSAWVNLGSTSDEEIFMIADGTQDTEIGIRIVSQKVEVLIDGQTEDVTSSTSVTTGGWRYVVVTRSGSTDNIYINGTVDSNTASDTGTLVFNSCPLIIGAYNSSYASNCNSSLSRFFDGSLDEIRVANVARTAGWVQTEYNNISSPATFYTLGAQQAL